MTSKTFSLVTAEGKRELRRKKHKAARSVDIFGCGFEKSLPEKAKHVTGLRNQSIFGSKGNIDSRVASISARGDLVVDAKADLTVKVQMPRLTTLGAVLIVESSTNPRDLRAATGAQANREAQLCRYSVNPLLDRLNALWKLVIAEAPEISWIGTSSGKHWSLKTWTPDNPMNPPRCGEWMAALKTEAVHARIDHYVKSKHPQAHHEELRNLLPRLEEAIL